MLFVFLFFFCGDRWEKDDEDYEEEKVVVKRGEIIVWVLEVGINCDGWKVKSYYII